MTYLRRSVLLSMIALACVWGQEFADVQSRITDFKLANGMKFIVMERHQAPVATFYTYADVGSVNEDAGRTGLAHMFEHMAFKGTTTIGTKNWPEEKLALRRVDETYTAYAAEKIKGVRADKTKLEQLKKEFDAAQEGAQKLVEPNEFGRILDETGGRGMNASTAWDRTDYFLSLPSNQAELWFFMESERFRDGVLREFYKERDVVAEERRMRTDSNPLGKLVENFISASYKAHPYGNPPIGHMSDIQNYTRQDAEAFFKKFYIPSNLTCVIVGDVDPKQIKAHAEKYFGRIASAPKPAGVATIEPVQETEMRLTLRAQAQRMVVVGYHAASINDPDYPVYETIASLMSEGRSSRLNKALVKDKKVAVAAGGFPGLPGIKYPGLFLFFGVNAPGKDNGDVEAAMKEEIEKLKTDKVSDDELAGVRARYRVNLLNTFNSSQGMASQLAAWDVLTGDWRNLFQYVQKINKVSADDVQRIAKQTFVDSNKTVAHMEPAESK
jgi:predicted Zn-dependent peptidase